MNLKQVLRKRLFDDMINKVALKEQGIVMVLSEHTSAILSSCARMYDVMEAGVLVLENISRVREPLPDSTALYFLQPTSQHVSRLIEDFTAKKPQYRFVYLYFTTSVPEDLVRLLKNCRGLTSHLKCFTEINTDFTAREGRVFTFDRPITTVIKRLYLNDGSEKELLSQKRQEEIREQAKRLVSFCLTLHEFPFIRYAHNSRYNLSREFAKQVDAEFKKALGSLPSWKASDRRDRGTLLILDRSVDLVAPLIHEFTYQAMVNDLLPVRGEMCTLKVEEEKDKKESKKDKETPSKGGETDTKDKKDKQQDKKDKKENNVLVLSDEDPLWVQYRHNHIGEVIPDVTKKFKEFKQGSRAYEVGTKGGGDATLKEMIQAMKEMPKFKDLTRRYHKHLSLATECMKIFDEFKLGPLGDFEQDMATGLDNDGKKVSQKEIKSRLVKMCQDDVISTADKLRLLMIYLISQGGISDSTLKELMKNVDKKLQRAVSSLPKFGIEIQERTSESGKTRISEARMAEFAERNNSIKLTLMRYVPLLRSIILSFLKEDLSEELYPYTSPPPPSQDGKTSRRTTTTDKPRTSARRHAEWRHAPKPTEEKVDNRPLLIVFVLGGVTFSETRTLYELAEHQGANLIIGSSNTITPNEFVRSLSGLKSKYYKKYITGRPDAHKNLKEKDDDDDEYNFVEASTNDKDKKYETKNKSGGTSATVSPMATPGKKINGKEKWKGDEDEEIGEEDDENERSESEEEGKGGEDSEDVPVTRIHSGGGTTQSNTKGINNNKDTNEKTPTTRKLSSREKEKEESEACCSGCIIV